MASLTRSVLSMIRHALHGLLNSVILLVLLIIGAAVLAQTAPGKRFLASQLSSWLSTPETGIEITGIQGWIPIDMQIDRLQLSDPIGIWFDATDLALEWSPKALLGGRMQIDTLQVKRVQVARLPDNPDEKQPTDEPFRLPPLPKSLPPITIAELSVEEIDLEPPVLGEAASFELDGSLTAADDGGHADLTLDLQRLDQATAYLTLTSTINLDPATLAIDLDAGETGKLLERITGRKDAGDLDLILTGQGPLDDWSGQLTAQADGLGTANADLSLALVEQPQLQLDVVLEAVEGALPADIEDLIGEDLDLNLAVTQTQAQAIDVERFEISADQLGVKGSGKVDFEHGDITLNAAIDAPELRAFNRIAGVALTGEAGVTANIDGTIEEPRGVIAIRGHGLSADGFEISDLDTTLNVATTAPLTGEHAVLDIKATGSAEGLTVPNTPLPDDKVSWTADLLLPLDGIVTVKQLAIKTADAVLRARGTVDPKTLVSNLDAELDTEALHRLLAPYGQDFDGKAAIEAAVQTTEKAKVISIDLNAALSELAGLPDGAIELIGDRLDVEATIKLDELNHLTLRRTLLEGANATVKGDVDLDLESGNLTGEADGALPDLARLATLIDRPIDGALDLGATISGSLDEPEVELTLTSETISIADEPIEALSLIVNERDLSTSPEGKLQLDLTARTTPLALTLAYRLDETVLVLQNLDLKGPRTVLGGDLTIDLDTLLVGGALQGSSSDLRALRPLLHQSFEGEINLEAQLSPDQGRQNAVLSIRGQNVGGDFGQIKEIDLTATLQDLLGKPAILAEANLKGFEQDQVVLSTASLQTEGDLERLTIDLNLDGQLIEPLSLEAGGALSLSGPIRLDVDRLNGLFGGEKLNLNGPMYVEQSEESLEIANLDLRLGAASLTAKVDIGHRDVDGKVSLRSLPLTWLERFNGPELEGIASADIDLAGTINLPRVQAVLNLDDIEVDKVAATELPPIDVTVRANLDNGRLASSLVTNGITKQAITANAALPFVLKLRPFVLVLPEDGKIEGAAKAKVSLIRIGDLLALDGHILKGILTADLNLAGTIKEPRVDGPVELEGGFYENIRSGTELRDIQFTGKASSTRINIDQLTAKAGKVGKIEGIGWIDLSPSANFPLSLSLSSNQAQLVDRDDFDATVTGDVTMRGNLDKATIGGKLIVNRADISIPEGGGSDLPIIEYEEIGGKFVKAEDPGKAKAQPFDPELDLTIDSSNKVYIRGRGLESEWEGNLRITGPTSNPRITGGLQIKKGFFDFIEKRFEIETGIIDFKGALPPNPILAIEAAATDGDFKAIVKLDGPAGNPKLRLESEPALPEDEVLARLLFNRELSEIGPVEAAKLALALNKLRGGGGFDVFGEVRDALNIDTLDIVGGEEAADSRIKAGKYLNDEVYLEVEQGAGGDSSRARVEIEILPSISLEADTGTDSTGGVGVKWRFDY